MHKYLQNVLKIFNIIYLLIISCLYSIHHWLGHTVTFPKLFKLWSDVSFKIQGQVTFFLTCFFSDSKRLAPPQSPWYNQFCPSESGVLLGNCWLSRWIPMVPTSSAHVNLGCYWAIVDFPDGSPWSQPVLPFWIWGVTGQFLTFQMNRH